MVTCYSPGRHFTHGLLHFLVRLACVRHAASVDSEPGSNSHLKPVVCRRVVGRLPPRPRRGMAVYLVRSLGFQPEPSSHDWHVQPSCQRTDPLPPERALSVQCRNTQVRPCLSSKLIQTTRLARRLSTRCDHRISTCFPQIGERLTFKVCHSETASAVRNLLWLSPGRATKRISHTAPMPFSAQAEAEDD